MSLQEPEPEDEDYPEDYDVVPLGLNVTSEQADSVSNSFYNSYGSCLYTYELTIYRVIYNCL